MNKTPPIDRFFEAFPEAPHVFGVSVDIIRLWLRDRASDALTLNNGFPRAVQEAETSRRLNISDSTITPTDATATILKSYRDRFLQRINDTFASDDELTPERKRAVLNGLRDEFFAFPTDTVKRLEQLFVAKRVASWDKPTLGGQDQFDDFLIDAIKRYGQEAVPFFNQKLHLHPGYTGFVRNVTIYDHEKSFAESLVFEAESAYIENGRIRWFTREDKRAGQPILWNNKIVIWKDGPFELEELYFCDLNTQKRPLKSQKRRAKFLIEDGTIDVNLVENTREIPNGQQPSAFSIFVTPKKFIYGESVNVHITVKEGDEKYEAFVNALQSDPYFPSRIENLKAMFPEAFENDDPPSDKHL